jgi:hypothetical protein
MWVNRAMSKHETPMTLAYWKEVGGLLVEELEVVPARRGVQGRRCVDALILPNRPRGRIQKPRGAFTAAMVRGEDVVVVQTKRHRLGTYLLGQAAFSRLLVERLLRPGSVRSVALCAGGDAALERLADESGVEVVVQPGHPARSEPKSPARGAAAEYWRGVGGTLIENYPIAGPSASSAQHAAEAVVILDGERERLPPGTHVDLSGRDVLVIASAGGQIGFGMYVTGAAYFARRLIEGRCGPGKATAITLVPREDAAMRELHKWLGGIDAAVGDWGPARPT